MPFWINFACVLEEMGREAAASGDKAAVRVHYESCYQRLLNKLVRLEADLERQAAASHSIQYVMDDTIVKPQLVLAHEGGLAKVAMIYRVYNRSLRYIID